MIISEDGTPSAADVDSDNAQGCVHCYHRLCSHQ